MTGPKFRSELKHYINVGDYVQLRAKLKHLMRPDAHASPDGCYKIRSLYFDKLGYPFCST